MSALQGLMTRPDLLKKIFLTDRYHFCSAYVIQLCVCGAWTAVAVDDCLPCSVNHEVLYAQAKHNQLWAPLIEKALAKIHGSYEALKGGTALEGLATLTGFPCESLKLVAAAGETSDIIWTRLLSSKEAGFPMVASIADMDVDKYESVDLVASHGYGVLDVRAEKKDNGDPIKLLQLCNPCAQRSWSGDWSNISRLWQYNPNLERLLNHSGASDGIFWICFDDLSRYFKVVDICKVWNWHELKLTGSLPDSTFDGPTSYFLHMDKPTEIHFSMFQKTLRGRECDGQRQVDPFICVFKSQGRMVNEPYWEPNLGPLVATSCGQAIADGTNSYFLDQGCYQIIILAFNHWARHDEHPKFMLALHGSRAYSLSVCPPIPLLFADSVIRLSMQIGQEEEVYDCVSIYYLKTAGLTIVAENRHPVKHLQLVCDCSNSTNVQSTRGVLRTKDSIPPLHRQVVIVLTKGERQHKCTINYDLLHSMEVGSPDESAKARGDHYPCLPDDIQGLHMPRSMR